MAFERVFCFSLSVLCLGVVSGCASFSPRPLDEIPFMERAETQTEGPLRVTAAVLSAEESEHASALDLYDDEPRHNLTGDPYFTDGFRLVMWLTSKPVSIVQIEFLDWEIPPPR